MNDEDSSQSVSEVHSGILESRTLFVDTSEFERLSYAFGSGILEILSTHDRVTLLLPEVVELEIRDRLKKAAQESVRLHKSFSDKARVLRNLGDPGIVSVFNKFDADEVTMALIVAFEKFTGMMDTIRLPVSTVDPKVVFDRYVATRPPFGSGEKKHEFPDAFALESIRNWAIAKGRKVYVASQDNGMKEYCDEVSELVYVQSVDQFLDLAILEDQEAATKLRAVIDANQDSIESFIEAEFPSLGFFVDDREGDVNDVRINEIEIHAMSIVKLDAGVATVELDLTINFVADVSYDDIEHGIYDSETKTVWTQQETGKWEREYDGSSVICVSQNEAEPTKLVVKSFQINDGEDIALSYDDGWPYK
jgi:hypothetical protein